MNYRHNHRRSSGWATATALLLVLLSLSGCLSSSDPIAILATSVISGPAPLTIEFDISYSMHPQGRAISFVLDFGDGSDPEIGTEFGIIIHHTYDDGGSYNAVLTVTDDRGHQAVDTLTLTVSADGPPEGIVVGATAPDFTAPTTDGTDFSLSDVRGQVVVLDFWGAWCAPCRKSLPHLNQLLASHRAAGLVAVLISTDTVKQDSIDYLEQNGFLDFISIWQPGGRFTPIAELYGVLSGGSVGIPHTFLIDRQGVIRWVGHPSDLLSEMIETLL